MMNIAMPIERTLDADQELVGGDGELFGGSVHRHIRCDKRNYPKRKLVDRVPSEGGSAEREKVIPENDELNGTSLKRNKAHTPPVGMDDTDV
jgi:hypothetical protein